MKVKSLPADIRRGINRPQDWSDQERREQINETGRGPKPWPMENQVWQDSRGHVWLLTSDDAYWVRADGEGLLVPATGTCVKCGCPLTPVGWRRCCWCLRIKDERQAGMSLSRNR